MKIIKLLICSLVLGIAVSLQLSTNLFGETTKTVNFMQRIEPGVIEPELPGGPTDQGLNVKCILYKESGRCVFDPDIETIQKYEIYNGSTCVGVYYNQYNFVQDAFNLRGILILNLITRNSTLSGKVYNY